MCEDCIPENVAARSKKAIEHNGGRATDLFEDVTNRLLVRGVIKELPGALLWIHPALSRMRMDLVKVFASETAKELCRNIYWAKDQDTKWEVLSTERYDESVMCTEWIARFGPGGEFEFEIIGVS